MPATGTLQPLARTNLADQACAQLRDAIILGEFPQGEPISEPTLATRFGVSRAPIREALIELEREGLVEFDVRGRTKVVTLTLQMFQELVTLRVSLEGLAARLTAESWSPDIRRTLKDNLELQQRADTFRELTGLDVAFHEAIVRAANHGRLLTAWLTIRSQFAFWLAAAFRHQELKVEPRTMAVASHRKLLTALASGNPDRAEREILAHIRRWRDVLPEIGS